MPKFNIAKPDKLAQYAAFQQAQNQGMDADQRQAALDSDQLKFLLDYGLREQENPARIANLESQSALNQANAQHTQTETAWSPAMYQNTLDSAASQRQLTAEQAAGLHAQTATHAADAASRQALEAAQTNKTWTEAGLAPGVANYEAQLRRAQADRLDMETGLLPWETNSKINLQDAETKYRMNLADGKVTPAHLMELRAKGVPMTPQEMAFTKPDFVAFDERAAQHKAEASNWNKLVEEFKGNVISPKEYPAVAQVWGPESLDYLKTLLPAKPVASSGTAAGDKFLSFLDSIGFTQPKQPQPIR